jgi:hypothetical protein
MIDAASAEFVVPGRALRSAAKASRPSVRRSKLAAALLRDEGSK